MNYPRFSTIYNEIRIVSASIHQACIFNSRQAVPFASLAVARTSTIGLCQEGRSSTDAFGGARAQNSFSFLAACVGFRAVVPISDRTRLPLAVSDQQVVLQRRLSLCFPASLETCQRQHPELALFLPVALTARPGRSRVEEILLIHRHVLRGDARTRLYHLKIPLPAVARLH
jgi:hypothetical protein